MKEPCSPNHAMTIILKKPSWRIPPMLILLMLFMLIGNVTHAQFNRGRFMVGGVSEFSSTTEKYEYPGFTSDKTTTNLLGVAPQAAYFVANRLAIGVDVDFVSEKSTSSTATVRSNGIVAGPLVRYYLKPGIFFQGEYQLGAEHYTISGTYISSSDQKATNSSWKLSVGYALFLNEHVAIEPIVSYQSTAASYSTIDYHGSSSGLLIGVGFQVYLGSSSN